MKLFLGLEAQQPASRAIAEIISEVRNKLRSSTNTEHLLEGNNGKYGEEFDDIAIIPTCSSKAVIESLGWKERRLVRFKKKDADIRLMIDYDSFLEANSEEQRRLYVKCLLDSIKIVQEKSRQDFRGQELIDDIMKALSIDENYLTPNVNASAH